MEGNPYRPPKEPGSRSSSRFRLKHIPLVIAGVIGAFVLFKIVSLFIELAIALVQEARA
jgi:hypothetical protein